MKTLRKIPIHHRLPITLIKLFIARVFYKIYHHIFRIDRKIVRRRRLTYDLDLSEGIDFYIFLFGHFQKHIFQYCGFPITDDAVIFDVGANMGCMTLPFAQMVPKGHVYSFEPTHDGFKKLKNNLSLNPNLLTRVTPIQTFVSNQTTSLHELKAYSSWKINHLAPHRHPVHGGCVSNTDLVPSITIDDFFEKEKLHRIDLMKIDTDGYELDVLEGSRKVIEKYRPYIIFEFGFFSEKEIDKKAQNLFDLLIPMGYSLINMKSKNEVTSDNFFKEIPYRYATDILARPS